MHDKPQLSCQSMGQKKIDFVKYNANGNDFIIIDEKDLELSSEQQLEWLVKRASSLCDRYRGIGADGILFVQPKATVLLMHVINADGSIAQNCGNGLRCVARWWFEKATAPSLTIELAGRHYICSKEGDHLLVDMGVCSIERAWDFPQLSCEASIYEAHLGNSHIVLVSDEALHAENVLAEIKHKYLQWTNINIGFVDRKSRQSIVYERGVGFTRSCGSGAIAAALALRLEDSLLSHITIHQPGGDISMILSPLVCSHAKATFRVSQLGEAKAIFCGHIGIQEQC